MTQITFRVQRYSAGEEDSRRWQDYSVDTHAGMTILEGLLQIRERSDASLVWRHSCRMGVCGSCAMVINGVPGLACNTQIQAVSKRRIRLESLSNFPIARDLVPDLDSMFEKHRDVAPYLVRDDGDLCPPGQRELLQSPAQLDEVLQFTSCIKCGACMAACPTVASDPHFLGPMPLTAAHRYNRDSRDTGFSKRKKRLARHHSIAHCHYAAECSRVCPKGVDPARAIQLMKRDLVIDLFRLRREHRAQPRQAAAPRSRDELNAPGFTVKND